MTHYAIGLDIGGTKIAAGAVDSREKIVKKIILPTEARRGKKIILKNILAAASKVWLPGVRAIGVGMAGQCDFKTGFFVAGANFPKNFKNINIKKILEIEFRVPVSLDNDARAFTLAEAMLGAGHGHKNVFGVTLGTGIGGGIVIEGKIFRGGNNLAGEFGHTTIDISSPLRCSCGHFGHLEALASGKAMINLYKKLTGKTITTFDIEKKYKNGETAAKKVSAMISDYLALGFANLAQTLNPDIIVVGGGMSKFPELLSASLRKFKKEVIFKSLKKTKIVRAKFDGNAGIIGAALLTHQTK